MSPAQEAAFNQIKEIMREHFESGVIVVEFEVDDHKLGVDSCYNGGLSTALGLLDMGKHELLVRGNYK